MTVAIPATSSGVSPFIRSAARKAPSWAGVASPSMISRIVAAASSMLREPPDDTVSMASLINDSSVPHWGGYCRTRILWASTISSFPV